MISLDVLLKTRYGTLKGEQKEGFMQFLGVPFAKPPLGELRFRKPQSAERWGGVRDATRYADYCAQPGKAESAVKYTKGSEDCLYLNVFTPGCDKKKRPVVIWIHGGAYLTGAGSSCAKQGDRMCREYDMVVVSIQYRLGAFGCVDFAALSGLSDRFDHNCGTWDQVAAVNWVIENIMDFGGDPDCVTLMGESAGACSVLTLITTPYLKGKIRRAIMDSPAPLLMNTAENGRLAALDVLDYLGLKEHEAYQLAGMSAERLTKAVNDSEYNFVNHHPYLLPTAPVVDGDLIPELPFDALRHGAADGIELLIGTTKDEGTLFAMGNKRDIFPGNTRQMEKFFADHPEANRSAITALYPDYPGKRAFQEIGKELFFHLPSIEIADRLSKTGKVYMHHFDYAFPVLKLIGMGAVHCTNSALTAGVELQGLAKLLGLFSGKTGKAVAERIHHYWCSFIVSGDPNGAGEPIWPEYGKEKNTLFIDARCHVEKAPFSKEQQAYGLIRPYKN